MLVGESRSGVHRRGRARSGSAAPIARGNAALLRRVASREGLILDPVYTNKAFHGLIAEAAAGRLGADGATVFIHTGGIFGLFQLADRL